MTNVPIQVIVAVFLDEEEAEVALKSLEDTRKQGTIDFEDAAVVKKDEDGKLHVKETTDVSTGRGAAIGGVIGGVLGLIGGPAGMVILGAAGAAIGGLAAHGDTGFKDERLEKLGVSLEPGTSAVVAVVARVWVAEIEKRLAESAVEVTVHEMEEEMVNRMREGKGVTYTAGDIEGTEESEI
jgi:uncharacterized membrane protein